MAGHAHPNVTPPEHRTIPMPHILQALSERLLECANPARYPRGDLHPESRAGLFRALSEALKIPAATPRTGRGGWTTFFSAGHPSTGGGYHPSDVDRSVAAVVSAVIDCATAIDAAARSAGAAAALDDRADTGRRLTRDVLGLIQRIVGESLSRLSRLRWLEHQVGDGLARERLAAEVSLQQAQASYAFRALEAAGISLVMYDDTADTTWFVEELVPATDAGYAVDNGATLLPAVVTGDDIIVGVYARRITVRTS
jgi:hypothetical protein